MLPRSCWTAKSSLKNQPVTFLCFLFLSVHFFCFAAISTFGRAQPEPLSSDSDFWCRSLFHSMKTDLIARIKRLWWVVSVSPVITCLASHASLASHAGHASYSSDTSHVRLASPSHNTSFLSAEIWTFDLSLVNLLSYKRLMSTNAFAFLE